MFDYKLNNMLNLTKPKPKDPVSSLGLYFEIKY